MAQSSNIDKKQKMKVVIVGGGVGGMSLAMDLTRKDKDIEIIVIKKEQQGSYSPCGIPFVLEGKVKKMEDIILQSMDFYRDNGIILKTGSEASNIDLEKLCVQLDSGETINYDNLVIATGRKPFILPIEGVDLEGVFTLSDYDDGLRVLRAMRNINNAVIIGGGIIGLETVTAFAQNNIHTTIIEMLPSILPRILDPDMATIVQNRLESMDIEILTSTKVLSIKGNGKVESVIIQGREIKADFVLLVTGIRPNVDLAKRAGIAIGEAGGVVTNSLLNVNKKDGTTLKNVFALGDCIETKNRITKSSQISALASTAVLQARVVAENICGGDVRIDGYLNPTITVIGGLQIGSVGLNSHTAEQFGLSPAIIEAFGPTQSVYMPDKKQIHIKLLTHNDQLIGAQIISEEDVKERMNALTLAIQNRMTINELLYTERCYTPSLSALTDPIIKGLGRYKKG